ncbi:hypothetical protein L1887_24855 [Cichorium endivia]|nr:hypothetical protein L1887_24855 [Cichorium endivia]
METISLVKGEISPTCSSSSSNEPELLRHEAMSPADYHGGSRCTCSDDWSDWMPQITSALPALYLAKLVNVYEIDQIGEHFKEDKTRIGLKMFLDLHLLADQAQYVHDTLAKRPHNRGKPPVV